MESMRYRRMGNSDLVVSEIGYGCWPMGGEDFGAIDDAETARAVDRAINSGVTLFDTAPAYSHGRAEEVLGNLLVGRRGNVILVTKCGLHWDTDADPRPLRRDSSRASVLDGPGGLHASLRRLRTDYLDLWLVHWPDVSQPFDDVMAVLIEAKAGGKGAGRWRIELPARPDCDRFLAGPARRQPSGLQPVRPSMGAALVRRSAPARHWRHGLRLTRARSPLGYMDT